MRGGTSRWLAATAAIVAVCSMAAPVHAGGSEASQAKPGPAPDVAADHWAAGSIAFVLDESRAWMTVGAEGFRPSSPFTRRDLAVALTRAFPPKPGWASEQSFTDVTAGDADLAAFQWAARKRWLPVKSDAIRPDAPVARRLLDQAMVRALGFAKFATPVSRLRTADGQRVVTSWSAGFLFVAERIGLHRNFSDESLELRPGQPQSRAHVADVLRRMADAMAANRSTLEGRLAGYLNIELPAMSPARLAAARFAFRGAGFPYVWAGEYHKPSSPGYPYGSQAQGGFDCTGFAWWVLHRSDHAGYDLTSMRGYEGWNLPWRRATHISDATKTKHPWKSLMPMDLGFFDFDADRSVIDHVGLMLGNGWVLHSSGSKGGVTLEQAGTGYMRNAFLWARRVIPVDQ